MRKIDLVWLAGFIDGEGYIGIVNKGTRYQTQLRVATTHLMTMTKVANLINGRLYHIASKNYNWKDCYVTVVYDKTAEDLIRKLLPFLVSKKEQAKTVLEFRKTVVYGRNQFSPDVSKERSEFYTIMKQLNHRGK